MTTPELFTFTPTGGRVESSSFSVPFKVLATALIAPAVAWGWHMWSTGVIAWTLAQPGLTFALCGARNPDQARENAKAGRLRLTETDIEDIIHSIDRHLSPVTA